MKEFLFLFTLLIGSSFFISIYGQIVTKEYNNCNGLGLRLTSNKNGFRYNYSFLNIDLNTNQVIDTIGVIKNKPEVIDCYLSNNYLSFIFVGYENYGIEIYRNDVESKLEEYISFNIGYSNIFNNYKSIEFLNDTTILISVKKRSNNLDNQTNGFLSNKNSETIYLVKSINLIDVYEKRDSKIIVNKFENKGSGSGAKLSDFLNKTKVNKVMNNSQKK